MIQQNFAIRERISLKACACTTGCQPVVVLAASNSLPLEHLQAGSLQYRQFAGTVILQYACSGSARACKVSGDYQSLRSPCEHFCRRSPDVF